MKLTQHQLSSGLLEGLAPFVTQDVITTNLGIFRHKCTGFRIHSECKPDRITAPVRVVTAALVAFQLQAMRKVGVHGIEATRETTAFLAARSIEFGSEERTVLWLEDLGFQKGTSEAEVNIRMTGDFNSLKNLLDPS
jgi:hypothetical protein